MKTFLYHLPIMLGLIGGETHAEADSRAEDEEIADVDTEEADRQVAQKLMDPDFSGTIGLGSEEGWNAYIDKENQLVVASRGDSSITLDPNELDDADLTRWIATAFRHPRSCRGGVGFAVRAAGERRRRAVPPSAPPALEQRRSPSASCPCPAAGRPLRHVSPLAPAGPTALICVPMSMAKALPEATRAGGRKTDKTDRR